MNDSYPKSFADKFNTLSNIRKHGIPNRLGIMILMNDAWVSNDDLCVIALDYPELSSVLRNRLKNKNFSTISTVQEKKTCCEKLE